LEEALEASLGPFPAGEGEEELDIGAQSQSRLTCRWFGDSYAVGAAFWWFISRFEARFFTLF
jgi:hypothetical protein